MLRWIVNPMSFMEACAKSYGEIFTLRLDKNLPPLVIISNPQAQQQIFSSFFLVPSRRLGMHSLSQRLNARLEAEPQRGHSHALHGNEIEERRIAIAASISQPYL
ncbi:MAG: hypothetical protein V7K71_01535 [Nostoc sp.]|uniref:hypothetical protein n=1 Tax=Nostoc sp. TaxID=1180 RepID=UPI002FF74C7B